jgi:hypothetical protein
MFLQTDMTQHDTIIVLCSDGAWHCQREFRDLFIWSPHKRRADLELRGYIFEERRCEHGIRNSKDFRLAGGPPPKPRQVVEQLPNGSVRVTYV